MQKRGNQVLKNQKGFTLIEIIAVLVILGILSAVAVPKFLDMQSDAQKKAVEGAIGALKSAVCLDYAKQLLKGTATASSYALTTSGNTGLEDWTVDDAIDLGDFKGKAANTGGTITVTLTSGPSWFASSTATKTSTFKLY